jgi:hypothetical protein
MKTKEEKIQVYEKFFRKYGKIKSTENLSYQDAMHDAIAEMLVSDYGDNANLTAIFKRLVFEKSIDARRHYEKRIELSDEKFKDEICLDTGEVILAKNAILSILEAREAVIFEHYNMGYTLEEIALNFGYNHKTQVLRILRKVWAKIDSLKITFLYDSRYAQYQNKKKPDIKYPNYYEENGPIYHRNFLCLDQTKQGKNHAKYNNSYQGDMNPSKPQPLDFTN